jgi:hypothetical protein
MVEVSIWYIVFNCVIGLFCLAEWIFFPRDFEKEKNYKNMERVVANQNEYISMLRRENIRLREGR